MRLYKTPGRSSPQGTEHLGGTTLINTADVLPAVVLSFIFNADIRCIFIQSSGAGQCVPAKAFTNRLLSDAFHTYTILFPRLFASVILPKIRQNVNRNRRSKYSFRKYHPKRASKTLSQTLSVKLQKLSF